MNVTVNNEILVMDEGCNLFQLLENSNLSQKNGIAVAVNNSIISNEDWNQKKLEENDHIIIITATQGG